MYILYASDFTTQDLVRNKPSTMSVQTKDEPPLWTASSTQTSPRVDAITDDSLLIRADQIRAKNPIPKLGEIEQFSTETQTDDLEILLKPNEDAFTIEAQTQFDLDDILLSLIHI